MFKFNFSPGDNNDLTTGTKAVPTLESPSNDGRINTSSSFDAATTPPPAEEVLSTITKSSPQNLVLESLQITESFSLLKGRIDGDHAANALRIVGVVENDLIPGKYEGGFKLWECAIDLAIYLASESTNNLHKGINNINNNINDDGLPLKVLELGCGHGLPGIVSLLQGCTVHFQDYNKEVLELLTIPTVEVNWKQNNTKDRDQIREAPPARYFSGDWRSLPPLLDSLQLTEGYDVILTTETIYTLEGMNNLFQCIQKTLKKPDGICLVGAKSFYFGVGGGVAAFIDLACRDGSMYAERAKVIDDGVSNRREIVRLKWRC